MSATATVESGVRGSNGEATHPQEHPLASSADAGLVTSPAQRAALFELVSLLLTYPDAELLAAREELDDAAAALEPAEVREPVQEFVAWLAGTPDTEVQEHYVRTFDLRRRSGLYLTYYLHGDTRKRGIALLTLKQRYKAHGLRLVDGELPDLLPVVLEFAALVGPGDGEAPLRQHRRGIELLREALQGNENPYRHLLDAVVLVLPPLTESDRDSLRQLANDGPPVESVGLSPYGSRPESLVPSGFSGPDGFVPAEDDDLPRHPELDQVPDAAPCGSGRSSGSGPAVAAVAPSLGSENRR